MVEDAHAPYDTENFLFKMYCLIWGSARMQADPIRMQFDSNLLSKQAND